MLNWIELVGSAVCVIGSILTGVWFIVNKAVKYGENKKRLDDIERKTFKANCESHEKGIDAINRDLKEIKSDIVAIKSILTMKYKDAAGIFSMKCSPRQLNENGKKLFSDIEGEKFLEENKEFLFAKIDESNPQTALDVENAANIAFTSNTDNPIFNGLKNFVYNLPAIPLKDKNGDKHLYEVTLYDVCFVLSIPLRDMYLKEHPEILDE